ncbi:regulatory LuxR family protein [Chitinophaga skermanii]|uniref:Regulatory LuxR family protein n=1 Tax=Chitinophaga skermanii TaxID=331697 RepID=A0A327QWC1_9BACT|nr:response regulator transcription factor [Chitinophaga skermanii]RAJ08650.1 regulatory LuxR family protein [Chitinophaga skermanii]
MKPSNHPSSLLTKNNLANISPENRLQNQDYLEAVKAFARLTYQSVYVINYENMSFEYVSDNPLFLSGYSAGEVQEMGYQFYFNHVPQSDLQMLSALNEAGFDFYKNLPSEEKSQYSITYDFHLIHKDGRQILINHKLTPLFLTNDGKLWKSMCIVSMSHHKAAGNIYIYKHGSDDKWELDLASNTWRKSKKTALTSREMEILYLYAQGLTIIEIAERIFVAPDTVKYYRRRIFEKLGVDNIVEALSYAVNNKII